MLGDGSVLRFIAKPNERIEIYKQWFLTRKFHLTRVDNYSYPNVAIAMYSGFDCVLSDNLGFNVPLPRLDVLANELRVLLIDELAVLQIE